MPRAIEDREFAINLPSGIDDAELFGPDHPARLMPFVLAPILDLDDAVTLGGALAAALDPAAGAQVHPATVLTGPALEVGLAELVFFQQRRAVLVGELGVGVVGEALQPIEQRAGLGTDHESPPYGIAWISAGSAMNSNPIGRRKPAGT